ncbi:MAG: hypothetical protein H8E39_00140 [Alphaproteobacteria bacterium]|nr:hypothetical protein [Alphaproteobacteria bacterium]
MKTKRHEVTLVIRASTKCTKAEAVAAVKDCIHGVFYPFRCRHGQGPAPEVDDAQPL